VGTSRQRRLREGPHEEYAACAMFRQFPARALPLIGLLGGVSCQASGPPLGNLAGGSPGDAPGAAPAASASSCAAALDAAALAALETLPVQTDAFCVDAYARVGVYGAGAPDSLARACERVLGPGCQEQPEEGLERVVALRYLVRAAPGSSIDVVLSRFENTAGAYAHFTAATLGENDPAALDLKPLDAAGNALFQSDNVLGWRGRHVFWLHYSDEQQPEADNRLAASRHLPELAQLLSRSLPLESGLPAPVQRLPEAQRLPLGVRLVLSDALGVPGLGMHAQGYYAEGSKRWRVLTIVRPDAESAKDVLSTLRRHPAAKQINGVPLDTLQFIERRLPTEPVVGWVVGQRAEVVYGIGDEASVLPEFMPAQREAAVKLSLLEKLAKLTRIANR
jgi:uncharacterized protein DUF6599